MSTDILRASSRSASNGMKVVMLSQDMKVFEVGPTAARLTSYGTIFDELVIVVFGTGPHRKRMLSSNTRAVTLGGKGKVAAFFRGLAETRRAVKDIQADVVSAQDPFFIGLAGLIAAKQAKVPLQVQAHTDFFAPEFVFSSPRRFIEASLARLVLKSASCVRAVSERVAQPIREVTKAPVSILPIVPFISKTEHIPLQDRTRRDFSILAVSRLTEEKQLAVAIDAMRELSGATLTIVGDGPLREVLEKQAQIRRVNDRVRFVGWHDDVSFFFANADAFLSLSKYEGYGRSLVEAALHGLPIVTTDVGIVGELLRPEQEVLVVPSEPAAVAAALRRLIGDGAFARHLGEAAKTRALKHVITEDEYLARYREAMHTCIP